MNGAFRAENRPLTPMKAMRAKCLDCCCDSPKGVRLCTCYDCPLWRYRMGRRPRAADLEVES